MRSLACLIVLAIPAAAWSAAPTLTYLFPAGAARGSTAEVTAAGTFDPWPVQAWCSARGVEVAADSAKGTLKVTVAADAEPGPCWVRLYNAEGASKPWPFVVGTLPEVGEKEPNDDPKKVQPLAGTELVVNGRLAAANDVDHFALTLKKGQMLVASVEANRTLGSPMDGVLQVLGPDGAVAAENNDTHGLDPQVVYKAPRDGTYLARLFAFPATPDSGIRFAGGETFIYRLTLTTGGFADHAFPLAVTSNLPQTVALAGWNLPDAARAVDVLPKAPSWPVRIDRVANAAVVRVEPHATPAEREPNPPDKPQAVELPVTVSGHIDIPGDVDCYRFAGRKGQKLTLAVEARSLGSPLDPVLRVTDAAGKLVQEADDAGMSADPEVALTVPADGDYRVEVRDLYGHGGWRYAYRLRVVSPEPDYALTVAADSFTGPADKGFDIPVTVVRRNGFDGPIEVSIEGLPEGVKAAAVTADAKAKTATLKVQGDRPFAGPVRIVGRSKALPGDREARAALATPKTEVQFLWLTLKPAGDHNPKR